MSYLSLPHEPENNAEVQSHHALYHRLQKLGARFLRLIYPVTCRSCRATPATIAGFFCGDCLDRMPTLPTPACHRCAAPLPDSTPSYNCNECRTIPPAFDRAVTPFCYSGTAALAVQYLKYNRKTPLSTPMAHRLAAHLSGVDADRVAAIPLHPSRLRQREMNPALLLARDLARLLCLPLSVDDLVRTRATPPQVGLSKEARAENVKGAFHVARPATFRGMRILLLDDVYTTGATLREGAKTLMAAGARAVTVSAFARAMPWEAQ